MLDRVSDELYSAVIAVRKAYRYGAPSQATLIDIAGTHRVSLKDLLKEVKHIKPETVLEVPA